MTAETPALKMLTFPSRSIPPALAQSPVWSFYPSLELLSALEGVGYESMDVFIKGVDITLDQIRLEYYGENSIYNVVKKWIDRTCKVTEYNGMYLRTYKSDKEIHFVIIRCNRVIKMS